MRPELRAIVDALLARDEIHLDDLGEALGARVASAAEIDEMVAAIEAAGRTIRTPADVQGAVILRKVLDTARALRGELGRAPRPEEIAERSGLSRAHVAHALSLARVIQR